MTFSEIVSVTGKAGLYQVLNTRPDGMIVKSLADDKAGFISSRLHGFSLLENISIYTYTDSEPLRDVFAAMRSKEDSQPVPPHKSEPKVLSDYFRAILPEYDESQVYLSDIKKVVKWFRILDEKGLLDALTAEKTKDDTTSEGDSVEASTEKEKE